MRRHFSNITHHHVRIGFAVSVFALIVLTIPIHVAHAQLVQGIASALKEALISTVGEFFGSLFKLFFHLISYLTGWVMIIGAQFLDISVKFVINGDNYRLGGVYRGWTIFRDLVDMLFIFIILYAAVMTILQWSSFNTRRVIVNLIIVGLLLNFSFFITGFVIDIGNATARIIYDAITPGTTSIGATLVRNMDIAKIFKAAGQGADQWQQAMAYMLNAIFNIAAAFVFLAGAAMFVVRFVVLAFVLMLSPLAFAALILPQTQKYWSRWLSELINNTIVAPVFMLMMALVIGIANAPTLLTQSAAAGTVVLNDGTSNQLASTFASTPGLIMNFVIIIGLMVAALTVSKNIAGSTATAGTKWAGKAAGFGVGRAAWLGRNTAGRYAARQYAMNADKWRAVRDDPNASYTARLGARMKLASAKGTANASFDARSGKVGGAIGGTVGAAFGAGGIKADLGKAGGKGGYQKKLDDRVKRHQKELDKSGTILPEDRARIKGEERAKLGRARQESAQNMAGIQGAAQAKLDSADEALRAHRAIDTKGMGALDLAQHQQQESILEKRQQAAAARVDRHERRAAAVMRGRTQNVRRGPDSKILEKRAEELSAARKQEYVTALAKRGRKWTIRPDRADGGWHMSDHDVIAKSLKTKRSKAEQTRERVFDWLDKNKAGEASDEEGQALFTQLAEEEKSESEGGETKT